MTATYEPPLGGSSARHGESLLREVITSGPAYVRGGRSSRWHRVRSAERMIREWDPDIIREIYRTWCGQHAGASAKSPVVLLADDVPDGEPSCGTCEGRAIGADPAHPEWLFSPRRLDPPPWCPGSQTSLYLEDPDNWRRATCLVCHDRIKLGARGGAYSGTFDARRHSPGPGLIPGCPWHAWRELVRCADGSVTCRCQTIVRPGNTP